MSVHVAAGALHVYRANEHDTLLSEVATVQCVLLPRAFLLAGFNEEGKVVMARYNSYAGTDPAWEPHFFEQEFMNEPLLGVPTQLKAIFIGSDEAMLIPGNLYEEDAARVWLRKLYAITPSDVLHTYSVAAPDVRHVFALPAQIDKLLHRYFGETPILPVAAYQLHKPTKAGNLLQLLITESTVFFALHQHGQPKYMSQCPDRRNAEEIAWQAVQLCQEFHIPRIDLQLQCTTICDSCYEVLPELERYFPKIKWSATTPAEVGDWAATIYLLQQLYACAL